MKNEGDIYTKEHKNFPVADPKEVAMYELSRKQFKIIVSESPVNIKKVLRKIQ